MRYEERWCDACRASSFLCLLWLCTCTVHSPASVNLNAQRACTLFRYKKAWIYDCLLLKIKSTAVYTFLHENEYLPLPNPRTLYTYLRSLKADFGFDSSLFTVLKDKLQVLPERERRGLEQCTNLLLHSMTSYLICGACLIRCIFLQVS